MYKIFSQAKVDQRIDHDFLKIIKNFAPDNILVLTGKNSFKNSESRNFLISEFQEYYEKVYFYSDFENNPNIQDLNRALKKLGSKNFKLIVACGGGSVIDFAKLLKVYLYKEKSISNFPDEFENPTESEISLIAIPTTAGTGSEATHFSVLYDKNIKYSIASKSMTPEYSILNPSLCVGANFKVKSSCIIDAFSQAIESYWSVNANRTSIEFAKKSIILINKHIDNFRHVHNDENVIRDILLGAHYSGKAINESKTTAAHALSYSITSLFDIPHGHAVGMSLGEFFIINELSASVNSINCNDLSSHLKRMKSLRKLLGWGDPDSCNTKWKSIMKNLDLNIQIKVEENYKNTIKKLVNSVNIERLNNNPVSLSKENIADLYKNILVK